MYRYLSAAKIKGANIDKRAKLNLLKRSKTDFRATYTGITIHSPGDAIDLLNSQ